MKTPTSLDIAAASPRQTSPEHKRFQTLLAKIDKARQRLQAWQEQLPLFAQMHEQRVAPVLTELTAARRAWAFELETLQLRKGWSKTDVQTLSQMICDLCGALLDISDEPDEELKALYNRCAEVDFDTEGQQHLDAMKGMLESMAGVDLGDGPVESVDDLMHRARAQMEQMQGQRHSAHEASARPPRKTRTAAQKRAEDDAARISQTVRDVYRKLASALHPDRADPGATPEQRQQRTDRMAAANSAYEAGDLLALLTLQLQIEQVDIAHAAGVAATQVKHFNKVLAEQLRELEAEIDGRQHAFCASYGLMTEQRLDPAKLGLLLKDELQSLEIAKLRLSHERRVLLGDAAQAKRWLKEMRAEQRMLDRMDDDLLF